MFTYDINIDNKYFEPIKNGDVTLLIFDKQVLFGANPGDCLIATKGSYQIEMTLLKSYIKSFNDITNEEAKKAGFLNKDFLRDELISKYDIKSFSINYLKNIDAELFFLVEIDSNTEPKENNTVSLYKNKFNLNDYTINDATLWKRSYYENL